MNSIRLRLSSHARWLALSLVSLALALPLRAQSGRVIVLGFDGADARTVEDLMNKGQLPNLAKLREQGTFAPLGTTNPAESPVAWAALNSGQNPAKTGIPGFVKRKFDEDGVPTAEKGFQVDDVAVPLGELHGAPIPTWSPAALAAAIGGAALCIFLLVFGVLLRLKRGPTLILSVLLALVGAWGGWTMRSYLPATFPVTKNALRAPPFWETAAQAGIATRVIEGQQAWDREPVPNAKVLCGLGVPDARGDYVSYFVYTTDELHFARKISDSGADAGSGGYKLRVDAQDGVIESEVFGPDNFWRNPSLERELDEIDQRKESETSFKKQSQLDARAEELRERLATPVTVPMRIEIKEELAKVTIGTQSQELRPGGWSEWYPLTFELNPLLKVRAVTRAKLVSLKEPFELFLNTIEIDPAHPPFWQPISQPAEFSRELANEHGTFETVGWACLTHPLKDGIIDPATFLEDLEFTTTWREKLIYQSLARDDWKLFVGVFAETDRMQHMLYDHYDPEHPLYDAAKAARKVKLYGEEITLADAIPAMYRKVDRIVGKVMDEYLKPGDVLMLCADHGFQSFRRQIHLNNWLAQEGYLVLREGASSGAALSRFADWSKTRAYALGLGTIYINTKDGASKVGIVDPKDKDALCREIAAKFLAATDPDNGQKIGSSADLVGEIHSGPYRDLEADLLLGFAPTYRVSWSTTAGGMSIRSGQPGPFAVDNEKAWSGDHVSVDPALVKGIFFCNKKVEVPQDGVDLLHIAPTALAQLGVAVPKELDLPPLTLR